MTRLLVALGAMIVLAGAAQVGAHDGDDGPHCGDPWWVQMAAACCPPVVDDGDDDAPVIAACQAAAAASAKAEAACTAAGGACQQSQVVNVDGGPVSCNLKPTCAKWRIRRNRKGQVVSETCRRWANVSTRPATVGAGLTVDAEMTFGPSVP